MEKVEINENDAICLTVGATGHQDHKNICTRIARALQQGAVGLTAAALSAFVCLLMVAPRANAQRISQEYIGTSKPFNPSSCNTGDKKYVYWAAKDQVFRFKFDPKEPLYPRGWWVNDARLASAWQKVVPPAPMPTEAEGCFGNPLRAGEVPYMNTMAEVEFFRLFGRKPISEVNNSGYIGKTNMTAANHAFESSTKRFLTEKDCWLRAPGLWECLVSKGTDRSDYSINRQLIIVDVLPYESAGIRDLYIGLLNDTLTMLNRSYGLLAESRIGLFDSVLLATEVRIFPNEIDKLKPYHVALIRYVLDAHIQGYQWTNLQTQSINRKVQPK